MVVPADPDFTAPEGWLVKPTSPTAPVDVFFVYPTVLFNDTDWVMNPASPAMRAAAQTSLDTRTPVCHHPDICSASFGITVRHHRNTHT
jgi:hypothetical protein